MSSVLNFVKEYQVFICVFILILLFFSIIILLRKLANRSKRKKNWSRLWRKTAG